ncbi:hypothetical protein CDLVIII_1311 [Clostridium sp. DL-VIII]|uniref:hypothetical protein n=1 Tax=Clostridium sp. DL-VIII TaxID=641107 RepID=UPI00023AF7AE|nr:hypothetical protein [Clostridium sp. DL-VIII]EHI98010.1 hypothetical protein CDLVIII_1311 [Clostridium sp. DL-VIII]
MEKKKVRTKKDAALGVSQEQQSNKLPESMRNVKMDAVKKALLKYGIHNEKELDEAIKKMKPLNIGCMVSPINKDGTGKSKFIRE